MQVHRRYALGLALGIALGGFGLVSVLRAPPQLPSYELLTSNNVYAASVADPCAYATGQGLLMGQYFCLNGDGTSSNSAGMGLTAGGSPSVRSTTVCNNGTDCGAVSAIHFNGTSQYYETPNVTGPAGDFTACVYGMAYTTALSGQILSKDHDSLGRSFTTVVAPSAYTFVILGGPKTVTGSAGNTAETWALWCSVFDKGGGTADAMYAYQNGVLVGSDTNVTLSPSTTGPIAVARRSYPGFEEYFYGAMRMAFFTSSALSAGQIAALYRQFVPALTASDASAVSVSRTTPSLCLNQANTAGSFVPPSTPCISGRGLLVEAAHTNLIFRSDDFANAYWTKTNVTVTSNSTYSPVDSPLADTLESTVNGGLVESTAAAVTMTGLVARAYASVFVKTAAGTQAGDLILRDSTAGATRCTANFTATTTWQLVSCGTAAGVTGNNHTIRLYPGGTGGTGTIIAYGAQMIPNSETPTSYVRTTSAGVARADDVVTISLPASVTNTSACLGADVYSVTANTDWTPAVFGFGATNRIGITSATAGEIHDGTGSLASGSASDINGRSVRLIGSWSGAAMTASLDGQAGSGAYDGAITAATVHVGSLNAAGRFLNGWIENIETGSTTGACE